MKSPKDIRRESKSMMGWFVFCVVVFVLALGVAVWLALPSSNQTTTRAAIAQLSKVQPGDTLYWFDGPVRQLAVIRNIPEQQVIETVESELTVDWKVIDGVTTGFVVEAPLHKFYSYNEVYQALVTTQERP